MEPKIVTLGTIYLAGQPYYGSPEGGAFGKAWERFQVVGETVHGRVDPKVCYGLEVYNAASMTDHQWIYMPAVEVANLADLPGPLFGKVLPAGDYAVFTAAKGLDSISETFRYAYYTWLPGSDYEVAGCYDFELYDEARFFGPGPESKIDLYIPVRKKK